MLFHFFSALPGPDEIQRVQPWARSACNKVSLPSTSSRMVPEVTRPSSPSHCPFLPRLLPERQEQLVTRFQWRSWPMARLMFFRSQKERILKQFLKRGPFSCPKIELGSWELVAGWRGQSFQLFPSPSPEVTQSLAPTGTGDRNARPVQVTPGHSETSPSCVTVKCIQPTGSIYTITVSKGSVGFFLLLAERTQVFHRGFFGGFIQGCFFFVSFYFEQLKLLCPFPRPRSRCALEVLFAASGVTCWSCPCCTTRLVMGRNFRAQILSQDGARVGPLALPAVRVCPFTPAGEGIPPWHLL